MNSEHLISKKNITSYSCHDFSLNLNSNSHITNSGSFSPSSQSITFAPITPWDLFWAKAEKAQLVDSYRNIIQSTFENYLIDELNDEELQSIIDILEKSMKRKFEITYTKFEITYTLQEYFKYLIAKSIEKLKISINSIYLVGGILPSLLKNYYIRNINHVYKKQCKLLNIEYTGELISEELAADLDRIAPDTDTVSTINSGNLELFVNLSTRFFSGKLEPENENFGQNDHMIKNNNFYLELLSKPESEFTFVKLASDDHIVDSTFMHKKNENRCLFSHHGMKLNIMPLILKLNSEIKNDPSTFRELKLKPNNESCSAWKAMLTRLGKKIDCEDPTDRAWVACISNKSIGYSISDPNIESKLFRNMIVSKSDIKPLDLLKKRVVNHDFDDPYAYITLAFNAIMSLLQNEGYLATSREWWDGLMCEHQRAINNQKKQDVNAFNDKNKTFLNLLKKTLDCKSVSFVSCAAILQIYGSLLHSSFQSSKPLNEVKGHLTNPESTSWHEVSISQIFNRKTYALSIPLNLFAALTTLLAMKPEQLEALEDLINHVSPNTPYVKTLIPTGLFTDKLIDQALKCFEHPHKALKSLAYELLVIYALSTQDPLALKNLVKYLSIALLASDKSHYSRIISNFELALKGFPDEIKTSKIVSPMLEFCHSQKINPQYSLVGFCQAMVKTQDPDLIHEAVNVYVNLIGVGVNDRIHFIKTLLPFNSGEAARLLLRLQKDQLLRDDMELKLIKNIAEVLKMQNTPSYSSDMLRLSNCADHLCQRNKIQERQVCLLMAQNFFDQNCVEEAKKWFIRILKLVSKTDDSEALFFVRQKKYLSLISIDLPPNPTIALQTLSNLNDDELKLFTQIIQLHSQQELIDLSVVENSSVNESLVHFDHSVLVIHAKECLKNDNLLIKKIGFELILYCAQSSPITTSTKGSIENKKAKSSSTIDPVLINVLMSYLPSVISETSIEVGETLLNALSDLLNLCYGKQAESYLNTMRQKLQSKPQNEILYKNPNNKSKSTKDFTFFKEIYQTNCIALASTKHLPLCIISTDLFSAAKMKKLAPNLNESDQVDIALATIQAFLPEHVFIALKTFQTLEIENKLFNTKSFSLKKNEIFITIIEALIAQDFFKQAKECLMHQIVKREDVKTTDLWLSLLQKTLNHQNFGLKSTVEFWNIVKKAKGFPTKHSPVKQIDFMVEFINHLYAQENASFDDLVRELQTNIRVLNPSEIQKSELALIILNDLTADSKVSLQRLTQCYKILQLADLASPNEKNSKYKSSDIDYYAFSILWLKAMQDYPNSLNEEIHLILSKVLKFVGTVCKGDITSSEISYIYESLIKTLCNSEKNNKSISKELKNQIILHHLSIVDTLQTSFNVDLCFEYFSTLISLNLIETNTLPFAEQAVWLAEKVINKYPEENSKLQVLHKFLQVIRHNRKFITLFNDPHKKNIPIYLAIIFLKQQLSAPAKEWINITIEMHKNFILSNQDLNLWLGHWCKLLLKDFNQTEYCLTIFQYLLPLSDHSFDELKAQICFMIIKALSKNKPSTAGELLQENVHILIKSNQREFQELVKEITQNMLNNLKSPGDLTMFLNLTKQISFFETDFLLNQFEVLSKKMISSKIELFSENKKEGVVKALEVVFFSAELDNIEDEIKSKKIIDCRFAMIKILAESLDPALILCGLTELDRLKVKSQNDLITWFKLCNIVLQAWFGIQNIGEVTSCPIIDSLIRFQSSRIELLPILDVASNEKKLILFKLNRYLFGDLQTFEQILIEYFRISTAYLNDLEWIKVTVQFVIDAIFLRIVKSTDKQKYFFKYYLNLVEHFEIHSRFGLNILCKRMVERSLELNLSDSAIRSSILFAAGEALDWLISDYMKKSETKNIFSINAPIDIDFKASQSVKELIMLVEKYLFCMPVLKKEWEWDMKFSKSKSPKLMNETLFESLQSNLLLSHELFFNLFSEMVQKLEDWGYDKNYPLQASIFQLMVHNRMTPLRNKEIQLQNHLDHVDLVVSNDQILSNREIFLKMIAEFQIPNDDKIQFVHSDLSDNFSNEFENITHLNQVNALKTVLSRLIKQKNFYSSLKAIAIFDCITNEMWKSDLKELSELFLKVTDDDDLYPREIDTIGCKIVKIAGLFKNETQSLEMSTKLCLHFLNKLESNSIFKYILQCIPENSIEISSINLKSAFMSFPEFVGCFLFDKTHKQFAKFFEYQLDLFLKSESIAATGEIIGNFMINSLEGMEKWSVKEKKNIFDIVSQRFKLLIPLQDEYLEVNMNIICVLSYIGYFKSQPKHLVDAWNMIIQLFPSSRSSNFYCNTIVLRKLVAVMTTLCPSLEENKDEMKKSLCRLINPYITSVIVDDPTALEDNVNMLRYLDSFGFFDNNWPQYGKNLSMIAGHISQLKQLDIKKGISIETFRSVEELCSVAHKAQGEKKKYLDNFFLIFKK